MRLVNRMVYVVLSLALGLPLFAANPGNNQGGNTGQIQWVDDYAKAVAEAKASNKPLLLFFTGSNWCGWCKKMEKEVFQTASFAKEAGGTFVFVMVDFPMDKKLSENVTAQNAALKKKFGITGFPTVVILDSQENFIAETGYRAPEGGTDSGKAYGQYLKGLLQ